MPWLSALFARAGARRAAATCARSCSTPTRAGFARSSSITRGDDTDVFACTPQEGVGLAARGRSRSTPRPMRSRRRNRRRTRTDTTDCTDGRDAAEVGMNGLFRTKSVEVLLAELAGEHQLRRVLGPVSLTALGVGAIIGAGIFVLTGLAAKRVCRAGARALVRRRRLRLRARRALLRGVRRDGAGRRQRLHVRVRDARRALRVDHRLGPRARVRRRVQHGRARLVALLHVVPRASSAITLPAAWIADAVRLRYRRRRRGSSTGTICNLPACLVVLLVHDRARHRHPRERAGSTPPW